MFYVLLCLSLVFVLILTSLVSSVHKEEEKRVERELTMEEIGEALDARGFRKDR